MEPSGTLSTPSSISTFLLFYINLYQRLLQGPASDHSTVSGTVPGRSPQFSWIAPGRSKNTWLLRVCPKIGYPPKLMFYHHFSSFFLLPWANLGFWGYFRHSQIRSNQSKKGCAVLTSGQLVFSKPGNGGLQRMRQQICTEPVPSPYHLCMIWTVLYTYIYIIHTHTMYECI